MFFLAILLAELKRPGARVAALAGVVIALAARAVDAAGDPDPRREHRGTRRPGAADPRAGAGVVNLSSTEVWLLVGGLVVTTALVRAVGPVFVGGRQLPAPFLKVVALAAPPLLAALVVTNVLADGRRLSAGADTVGVALGGLLLLCRVPLVVAAAVAVAVTAGLRAFA